MKTPSPRQQRKRITIADSAQSKRWNAAIAGEWDILQEYAAAKPNTQENKY